MSNQDPPGLEQVEDDFPPEEHMKMDMDLRKLPPFDPNDVYLMDLYAFTFIRHLGERTAVTIEEWPQLVQNNSGFRDALLKGQEMGYRAVRLAQILRKPKDEGDIPHLGLPTAAQLAWNIRYEGNYHKVMLDNINSMKREGNYANSAVLIQSSGTGKSRMVDEQAKLVFTIPFNLRRTWERGKGAYPREDAAVGSYLCHTSNVEIGMFRACLFLKHLFSEVTRRVESVFPTSSKSPSSSIAETWREHLTMNDTRHLLYEGIIKACNRSIQEISSTSQWYPPPDPIAALRELISTLERICVFPDPKHVKVMVYFDEAQELYSKVSSHPQEKKTHYDVLCSATNRLHPAAAFFLFSSTQTQMNILAPHPLIARSGRQAEAENLQAPITETPFDCHPDLSGQSRKYTLDELGELSFLARFGRPLFWAMIKVSGEDPGSPTSATDAMILARQKLAFEKETDGVKARSGAKLAVLDVLITIDYEPRRDPTCEMQKQMVASHMRTAFSVPTHRQYLRSGYPSEPFLAEAANRQMHLYRENTKFRMVDILESVLSNGLLDLGQKGEVVMRLLLRMAYMDAIKDEQKNADSPNFSKGCSFFGFLEALFAECHHHVISDCTPDNIAQSSTLPTMKTRFTNAVVRFTHFTKAADSSFMTTASMVPCFVRGVGIICYNQQVAVDIVIPILLHKDWDVEEASMSALFIQVKRRVKPGKYSINAQQLDFLPTDDDGRAYVTLVAELGVTKHGVSSGPSPEHRSRAALPPPRYSIRAFGCTNNTWKVIKESERHMYTEILATNDFLGDHPRQGQETLQLVRRMLPFWDSVWFGTPAREPVEGPAGKPVGKPVGKPAGKRAEKPTGKPAGGPARKRAKEV